MTKSSFYPVKVLLIEDTFEFAEMTVEALNFEGIKADHASNVDQAIAYLQDTKPDLILLDLHLGDGKKGWDVVEFIKRKYGEFGVPVIVTTAYSDNANRLVGRLNFVRRYLVKPFTHRELFAAIDQVLELYKVEP